MQDSAERFMRAIQEDVERLEFRLSYQLGVNDDDVRTLLRRIRLCTEGHRKAADAALRGRGES